MYQKKTKLLYNIDNHRKLVIFNSLSYRNYCKIQLQAITDRGRMQKLYEAMCQ